MTARLIDLIPFILYTHLPSACCLNALDKTKEKIKIERGVWEKRAYPPPGEQITVILIVEHFGLDLCHINLITLKRSSIIIDIWYHIVENHDELASYFFEVLDTVGKPELIVRGNKRALKAARNIGKKKWLVVVYRELSESDGFVITAYLLDNRPKGETIWQQ